MTHVRLDEPKSEIKAYALFAHCFTCGKDIFGASHIAKQLTENGIAVVRFDFTGLGKSDGELENTISFKCTRPRSCRSAYAETLNTSILVIPFGVQLSVQLSKFLQQSRCDNYAPADTHHVQHHFASSVKKSWRWYRKGSACRQTL